MEERAGVWWERGLSGRGEGWKGGGGRGQDLEGVAGRGLGGAAVERGWTRVGVRLETRETCEVWKKIRE